MANWDQCDAFAHHVSDDGKERTVICDQGKHATPSDNGVWHHDPDLDILWRYVDDWHDDGRD
jgi:hypothetical protein